MKPIYNNKGEVCVRYAIKSFSGNEWEDVFSKMPAYKAIKIEETSTGKLKSVKAIFRVALTQEWKDSYKEENHGFKCEFCEDTGVKKDGAYCHCELGSIAGKYFKSTEEIKK